MASLFQEIKSLRTLFADSLPYFLLSLTLFSCFCDMMLKETKNELQTVQPCFFSHIVCVKQRADYNHTMRLYAGMIFQTL